MGTFGEDRRELSFGGNGAPITRRNVFGLAALGAMAGMPGFAHAGGPTGQLVYGVHISLAPYMLYYALHDAMLKPMPGEPMAHSLAESWSATEDGMSYSFVLRDGVTFHNGEKVTARYLATSPAGTSKTSFPLRHRPATTGMDCA